MPCKTIKLLLAFRVDLRSAQPGRVLARVVHDRLRAHDVGVAADGAGGRGRNGPLAQVRGRKVGNLRRIEEERRHGRRREHGRHQQGRRRRHVGQGNVTRLQIEEVVAQFRQGARQPRHWLVRFESLVPDSDADSSLRPAPFDREAPAP